MRRHGYVRLSRRSADPSDRRTRRMRAPSIRRLRKPPAPPAAAETEVLTQANPATHGNVKAATDKQAPETAEAEDARSAAETEILRQLAKADLTRDLDLTQAVLVRLRAERADLLKKAADTGRALNDAAAERLERLRLAIEAIDTSVKADTTRKVQASADILGRALEAAAKEESDCKHLDENDPKSKRQRVGDPDIAETLELDGVDPVAEEILSLIHI